MIESGDGQIPESVKNTSKWYWPVPGYDEDDITSGVGPRWGKTHKGIDIAAPAATPVVATREGVVDIAVVTCQHNYGKSVGTDNCGGGYGNYIRIDHGEGYISIYAHLSSVYVSHGQSVSPGQTIGTVGSTGNSTGYHLHFEIRKNGVYQDPEEYVNSSNVSIYTARNDSGDIVEYIPYNPMQIVGTRAAELSPQPMHAYVAIYIGDKILSNIEGKPNTIQNFEFDRMNEGGSTGSFTIFDDNWEEIEYYLSHNWDNIIVEYGYSGTNIKARYKLIVQDYTVAFNNTGAILNINCMSANQKLNLTPTTIDTNRNGDGGTYNPGEAIKRICEELGWRIGEFDATDDVEMSQPFGGVNEYPVTYILEYILPLAQKEGDTLRFYLIDSEENGETITTAYLKRVSYGAPPSGSIRTYIYQKGYDSVVENISFHVNGTFGGSSIFHTVTGATSSLIAPTNRSQHNYTETFNSDVNETPGSYTATDARQSVVIADSAGSTPQEAHNRLMYRIKNAQHNQYSADIDIIGDPSINLLDNVRIINVTDAGYLHHTSGIYLVLGAADTVSGGIMKTTLKLQRLGDINTGVELINYKKLIK